MTTFRADNALITVTNVISRRDVTVVELELVSDGGVFDGPITGQGIAVRSRVDEPNTSLGFDIALARALEHLSIRANRQVQGRMKHIDDTLEMNLKRAVDDVVNALDVEMVQVVEPKKAKKKKVAS